MAEHTCEEERAAVRALAGVSDSQIELKDDGFLSRGYTIDGGRLVFKFPKGPDTTYSDEIRNLTYLNGHDLGINMQSIAYRPDDDSFIGLAGITGDSLEAAPPHGPLLRSVGVQLGEFLRRLHSLEPDDAPVYRLEDLVKAWQKRYAKAKPVLDRHFSAAELGRIDDIMMRGMPRTLTELGENPVFSHSDLGDGNVLVDASGKVGVIDFSASGYMDEASDFMDVSSDALCGIILDAYGADDVLRKKVAVQRQIRPIFVLDVYESRGEEAVQKLIGRVRDRLEAGPL